VRGSHDADFLAADGLVDDEDVLARVFILIRQVFTLTERAASAIPSIEAYGVTD